METQGKDAVFAAKAVEWRHKAKTLSSPRRQWNGNTRQRRCLRHKAKALSSPRRQRKHKAEAVSSPPGSGNTRQRRCLGREGSGGAVVVTCPAGRIRSGLAGGGLNRRRRAARAAAPKEMRRNQRDEMQVDQAGGAPSLWLNSLSSARCGVRTRDRGWPADMLSVLSRD